MGTATCSTRAARPAVQQQQQILTAFNVTASRHLPLCVGVQGTPYQFAWKQSAAAQMVHLPALPGTAAPAIGSFNQRPRLTMPH